MPDINDVFDSTVFSEEDVITFPDGIPGFPEIKKYIIVHLEEHAPFHWLISVEDRNVRFVVINPLIFRPDYNPKFNKEELDSLQIENPDDLLLFSIVTLGRPLSESTANLLGPVFINIKKKIGKQIILDGTEYRSKEPVVKQKA